MAQLTSSNTAELKRVYTDEVKDRAVDLYAEFLSFVEGKAKRESADIGAGNYWHFRTSSGWGVAPTNEGGIFPDDSANASIQPYETLTQLVGKVSASLLYKRMVTGRGSFEDGFKNLSKERLMEILSLADRYMAGGSGDGVLATIETGANSATQTLAFPLGTLLVEPGMTVQIDDGDTTSRGIERISSVNNAGAHTITLAASVNTTTADKVRISRTASTGSIGVSVLNGLGNLLSDSGTVHNIARSSNPDWKVQVYSNGGVLRNYSDSIVHEALTVTEIRTKATQKVDVLVCNLGLMTKYNETKRADVMVPLPGGDQSGVNSGVNLSPTFRYGDRVIPFKTFKHIKPRTLYGLVTGNLKRFGDARPEWRDGGELGISSSSRTTAEETFLYWPLQFGGKRFNNMFRIDDFSDPALCGSVVGGTDV